ncbi:hypothetical protein [Actinobaculum sp. 352]|uniref:hypothetical protein n=1 Tax=Actinobaculum sp. 352 TaxID=2490946 RepID=UPI000F7E1200|nr:hypothetical protein [Actinobaculum sp. 352]RTE49622.1 hypothetical protein EKN07_06145 [Actinobaculum sp. 352]
MSMLDELDKLASGGGRSIFTKDSVLGETHEGTIVSIDLRQTTDFQTGKPQTWDNGDPKMQCVISLQTSERDDAEDDGFRAAYIKMWGGQRKALTDAARTAGFERLSQALAPGNVFRATYVRDEPPARPGMSPTKVYAYEIVRAVSAELDAVSSVPAQESAPATPTPAPAPTPAPTPAPAAGQSIPAQIQALAAAGMTDEQIGQALGLEPTAVAILRTTR